MDYKDIKTLDLYAKPIDLRNIGFNALVCGWGTVSQDNVVNNATGYAQYTDNLHCMCFRLQGTRACRKFLIRRDYEFKLICGKPEEEHQEITSVISFEYITYGLFHIRSTIKILINLEIFFLVLERKKMTRIFFSI